MKVWVKHKIHTDIFIPNKRTKLGREMDEFLRNGLKASYYYKPLEILGLPHLNRFSYPYVEIVGDLILIYLDEKYEPKDENLIEITKREFDSYFE